MADRPRHLNGLSPVGGDGTTDAITGPNRAYNSLSDCIVAEADDLDTAGDWLSIYGKGSTADSTRVDITGYTTSTLSRIRIYGEFVGTKYDDTLFRLESSQEYNSIVTVSEGNCDFYLMQFKNTATVNYPVCLKYDVALNGSTNRVEQSIFALVSGVTTGNGNILVEPTATSWHLTVRDSLAYGGRVGIGIDYPPATCRVDLINFQTHDTTNVGIYAAYCHTLNLYNCLVTNTAASAYSITGATVLNTGNNVSDDATSPDVAGRNKTITFVDEPNDDYSVADTETDIYQQGVGSGTQALVSNDSLNSVARPVSSPDIGAFQIAAITAIEFQASLSLSLNNSMSLSTSIDLAASHNISAAVNAGLTTAIELQANQNLSLNNNVSLLTDINLKSNQSFSLNSLGSLSTQIPLASNINFSLSNSADLTAGSGFKVSNAFSLNTQSALNTSIDLKSNNNFSLNNNANLNTAIHFSASNNLVLNATSDLSVENDTSLSSSNNFSLQSNADLLTDINLKSANSFSLNTVFAFSVGSNYNAENIVEASLVFKTEKILGFSFNVNQNATVTFNKSKTKPVTFS